MANLRITRLTVTTQAPAPAVRLTRLTAVAAASLAVRLTRLTATTSAPANVPTCSAGADRTVPSASLVTLAGTATATLPATIASWRWAPVSAGAPALSDPTAPSPTFRAPVLAAAATYIYGLTVTDSNGLSSAQDQVSITIERADLLLARGGTWKPAGVLVARGGLWV